MNEYRVQKESGINWLRKVPDHWQVSPLKYVVECNLASLKEDTADDYLIQYIDISNVKESGEIIEIQNIQFKDAPSRARRIVRKGNVIISTVRTYLKAIAKINNDVPNLIASTGFAVLQAKSPLNEAFLYYFMLFEGFIDTVCSISKGVSYPSITSTELLNISICVPPLTEQLMIVKYLENKISQIDKLINDKQKLIELLNEERTAIINQAVTKGINPDVTMKDSGVEWFGRVPAHWEIKPLKYIIKDLQSGVSVNSIDQPINGEELGVLKTSCVYTLAFNPSQNKQILKEEYSRAACPIEGNSIIISRMNTPELVGASGYTERSYPNLFLPDRLWQTVFFQEIALNVKWLSKVFIADFFRKLLSSKATGTSSSMKNISKNDFLTISIPYPSFEEQTEILKHIETQLHRISAVIQKTTNEIEILREYKTALISEVVTGKVDVHNEVSAELTNLAL